MVPQAVFRVWLSYTSEAAHSSASFQIGCCRSSNHSRTAHLKRQKSSMLALCTVNPHDSETRRRAENWLNFFPKCFLAYSRSRNRLSNLTLKNKKCLFCRWIFLREVLFGLFRFNLCFVKIKLNLKTIVLFLYYLHSLWQIPSALVPFWVTD